MTNEKPWYASRGIWGAILAAIASAIVVLNNILPESYDVPKEVVDQINGDQLLTAVVALGGFVSAILAWVGRVSAKKEISKSPF